MDILYVGTLNSTWRRHTWILESSLVLSGSKIGWWQTVVAYSSDWLSASHAILIGIYFPPIPWSMNHADAWYFHCYDSYIEVVFWIFLAHPLFNAPTYNHKPQLGPQHNHHDEVRKNGIPYALGLTLSIASCRNCLVNRNPYIVVEMTLRVGIK